MTLLWPKQQDYSADFRFTHDSRWLVRSQKTGSGEGSLFLYKLGPQGCVAATKKPLSELAWHFFYNQPASRKIIKPNFHIYAALPKGIDDNYSSLDEKRPDSRYLLISLSGDVGANGKHHQLSSVDDWVRRYDLQKGTFDVPQDFVEDNAEALKPQ